MVEQIDDTPQGEYMTTIFAANAQLYSANLSAEAKKGLHRKAKERNRKHHHYLKGSLVCAHCGSRLTFVKAKGKLGTIYPYFACIGRIRGTGCRLP